MMALLKADYVRSLELQIIPPGMRTKDDPRGERGYMLWTATTKTDRPDVIGDVEVSRMAVTKTDGRGFSKSDFKSLFDDILANMDADATTPPQDVDA